MNQYPLVTPETTDYLSGNELFNNLFYNTKEMAVYFFQEVSLVTGAHLCLSVNGFGVGYMQGQLEVANLSPAANMNLFILPAGITPIHDTYLPIVVLRAGAYVPNAIKIRASDGYVLLMTAPQTGDILSLYSISFLVNSYS